MNVGGGGRVCSKMCAIWSQKKARTQVAMGREIMRRKSSLQYPIRLSASLGDGGSSSVQRRLISRA